MMNEWIIWIGGLLTGLICGITLGFEMGKRMIVGTIKDALEINNNKQKGSFVKEKGK